MIALTGLLAWPYALFAWELTRDSKLQQTALVSFALTASVACCLFVPLDYDVRAGRSGSLVWWLVDHIGSKELALTFLGVVLFVGFVVWGGTLIVSSKERSVPPEIALFCLFMASFLSQALSWERYVEPIFLIVLTAFYGMRARAHGIGRSIFSIWFATYAALSVGKVLLGLGTAG